MPKTVCSYAHPVGGNRAKHFCTTSCHWLSVIVSLLHTLVCRSKCIKNGYISLVVPPTYCITLSLSTLVGSLYVLCCKERDRSRSGFDLWQGQGQRKARPALLFPPWGFLTQIGRKFAFWYCNRAADSSSYIWDTTLITPLSPLQHCCDGVAYSALSLSLCSLYLLGKTEKLLTNYSFK